MKIALHDCDSTKFPNLPMMKLSAHHKKLGDDVEWFLSYFASEYDRIYSSKVFTYTPNDLFLPDTAIKGGTGHGLVNYLDEEIEHICPDYDLYPELKHSIGFATRGCHRKCHFCIVPQKEGDIRPHATIDEFTRHDRLVLLDNNILKIDHGINQLELIAKRRIKLDINQGIDIRLVDK